MKIISGGQTGVDRAALDVALELGMECGGFCPQGRKAEDGEIPERYPLVEMASDDYPSRTKMCIHKSDATLIIVDTMADFTGGTRFTGTFCAKLGKSYFTVSLDDLSDDEKNRAAAVLLGWLSEQRVKTLNVAGPRESKCPGIYERARQFLRYLFTEER